MNKSPDAFRTISEVADDLDIPQHVLRFWETRFAPIRPLKRGGGRRYYRPDDVDLLKGIRQLLYGQGYTIKGVQRILRESGPRFVQAVGRGEQAVVLAAPEDMGGEAGEEEAADDYDADAPSFLRSYPPGPPASPERSPALAHRAEPVTASAPPPRGLSQADVDDLQRALAELRDCAQTLASLRGR